jgi:NAD+ kinase
VWPEVEALLMVPLSAHALFSRPLVISPNSMMAVEVLTRTDARGVLWCDGRRTTELPPGSRIEVVRSPKAVNLARMHLTPFSERLVRKFELPTSGWRGPVPPHEAAAARTTALPTVRGDEAQEQQKSTVGHEMPHEPDAPAPTAPATSPGRPAE